MSQLHMERVSPGCRSLRKIRILYRQAFPRAERAPFPLLMWAAREKEIDFFAFYDGGDFCGFAYLVQGETISTLMYLAVEGACRSRGYGAQMLALLRDYSGEKAIVLEIEQVLAGAANYEQRRRRRLFYLRNGFVPSGYGHTLRGVRYEILSAGDFSPEEYARLMHRFSRGMVRMKIRALPDPN